MKMRWVVALTLFTGWAAAEAEGITEFRSGVALFQQRNYAAALDAFEASYAKRRAATALSNIALCQKALGRPASARATLKKLLAEHASELAEPDRAAAEATLRELSRDVAVLTVEVSPEDASVTVDQHPVDGGAVRDVELDPGQHTLVATAPGHRTLERKVDAAGRTRLELKLAQKRARLTVTCDDPDAAIAVDGARRGYGVVELELAAETPHAIEVYKPEHESSRSTLTLADGEHREVKLPLGPKHGDPTQKSALPYDRQLFGPYAFVTASYYALGSGDPDRFSRSGKTGLLDTTFFGVRAGYLIIPTFGVEAMVETGRQVVSNGCYPSSGSCASPVPSERASSYELSSIRTGMLGRYATRATGDLRFVAVGGVGLVHHRVDIDASAQSNAEALPSGSGGAWNAFVHAEGGVELVVRRLLIDGVVGVTGEGADGLKVAGRRVYTESDKLFSVGLGVRVGYAF